MKVKDLRRFEEQNNKLSDAVRVRDDKIAALQHTIQTKESAVELTKKVSDNRMEEVHQR